MPSFEYTALDADGREQRGTLEAETPRAARAQLRERGLTALEVAETAARERQAGALGWRRGLPGDEIALIIRQLATLVRAAIPLEQALKAVAEQTEGERARNVVLGVRTRVLEGHTLADGLGEFPHIFPEIDRATVAAGEQAGHLDVVLERLADYAEARQTRGAALATALYYPAFLVVTAMAVVMFLMSYVIPRIVVVFEHCHNQLPLVTRMLVATSDFMAAWWWLLLAAAVAAVVAVRGALQKVEVRRAWHLRLLGLPVIGRVVRAANAEQFARTLAILSASSVPVLEALRIAAATMSNLPMREAVLAAAARVREGAPIARSLAASGLFPPLTIQLIASGEASGTLDEMLARAADHLEREVDNTVRRAQALLGPIVLLFMALIVVTIMASVLVPILRMNQQLTC
jgi:general secretion pathway protein F